MNLSSRKRLARFIRIRTLTNVPPIQNGFKDKVARFLIAELVLALEHLHLHGVIYRYDGLPALTDAVLP